jgi:hypothetical protein
LSVDQLALAEAMQQGKSLYRISFSGATDLSIEAQGRSVFEDTNYRRRLPTPIIRRKYVTARKYTVNSESVAPEDGLIKPKSVPSGKSTAAGKNRVFNTVMPRC